MKFAPAYVTYVLNENFEDAKTLFLSPLNYVRLADGFVQSNAAL